MTSPGGGRLARRTQEGLPMTHVTTGSWRRASLAATVVVALALSLAGTALGSHALGIERYAALEAAYTALAPLDSESVRASDDRTARRACDRLDPVDPLLGRFRAACLAIVRIPPALDRIGRCRTAAACLRASAALRAAITRYLVRARSANQAIDASVTDLGCRLALRTSPQELRSAERLRSVLRAAERALRTGSSEGLRRADQRFDAIDHFGPRLKQQRARFRGSCG